MMCPRIEPNTVVMDVMHECPNEFRCKVCRRGIPDYIDRETYDVGKRYDLFQCPVCGSVVGWERREPSVVWTYNGIYPIFDSDLAPFREYAGEDRWVSTLNPDGTDGGSVCLKSDGKIVDESDTKNRVPKKVYDQMVKILKEKRNPKPRRSRR